MTRKKRIWIVAAVLLIVTAGATFIVGRNLGYWRAPFKHRSFDSTAWISGDELARGQMVYDLLGRDLISGQAKAEVSQLLGEPIWRSEDDTRWDYSVDIGQDFFGDPWLYRLSVQFGPNGIVKDTSLMD